MTKPFALGTTLAMAVLLGCAPSEKRVPYAELGEDAVLVSVNGVAYTKGEFERDCGIRLDLLKLSLSRHTEVERDSLRRQFSRQAIGQFVNRELLLGEAARRRIDLSPEEMADFQAQFARSLSAKIPVSFGAVETVLGKRVTAFRNSLRKDALAAKMSARLRQEAQEAAEPSDEEVTEERNGAIAHNRAFAVTNRMAFALATNSWKSIQRGNDFATVGQRLHQMNQYVNYIPACDSGYAEAAALKNGELSLPLTKTDGIYIFRANKEAGAEMRYSCIFFSLAPIYEIESVEKTRQTLAKARMEELVSARLAALRKGADIRHPYGEEILR